ncbi:hypothetical protein NLO413_0174 [Candidatus Neoehrlichia lotoris str. RAC413]|uniref:Uncharacterized protein n=1 Tax=Candidatus Neoehrlichia procyonis str. RAC413 TaxID=1359163 RepID=A0A0F3NPG9_9RICK|nr:hypothetical protein NLO413_0174 [Candidatus Neoehrlichia lotoris str. RAC413]
MFSDTLALVIYSYMYNRIKNATEILIMNYKQLIMQAIICGNIFKAFTYLFHYTHYP